MIRKAWSTEYSFHFKKAAKTSRNTLTEKKSHFIFLENDEGHIGIGEFAPIYGLSIEGEFELKQKISEVIYVLNHQKPVSELDLSRFPSLNFALECAEIDMQNKGRRILFESEFTKGQKDIRINGLIWMAAIDEMKWQLRDKLDKGFKCIKIKVGSLNFEDELNLLKMIRDDFGNELEIRLDANGAFEASMALGKLEKLAKFKIHSIEQPMAQGQWNEMAKLCRETPIPIALDEELIGVEIDKAGSLLDAIKPQFIILKPTLLGGFKKSESWIREAECLGIGWWATSALESNIGLNAIAQWVFGFSSTMYQGLGTGQIYSNNIISPLELHGELLHYNPGNSWNLSPLTS